MKKKTIEEPIEKPETIFDKARRLKPEFEKLLFYDSKLEFWEKHFHDCGSFIPDVRGTDSYGINVEEIFTATSIVKYDAGTKTPIISIEPQEGFMDIRRYNEWRIKKFKEYDERHKNDHNSFDSEKAYFIERLKRITEFGGEYAKDLVLSMIKNEFRAWNTVKFGKKTIRKTIQEMSSPKYFDSKIIDMTDHHVHLIFSQYLDFLEGLITKMEKYDTTSEKPILEYLIGKELKEETPVLQTKQGTARQLAIAFSLMVQAKHLPRGVTDRNANARFIEFMTGKGFENVRKEIGRIKNFNYPVETQKEVKYLISDYLTLKEVFSDVLFSEENDVIDKKIETLRNTLKSFEDNK